MGPRSGLDDVEKRKFLAPSELELGPLGRPVRSQSLYRLAIPAPYQDYKIQISARRPANLTDIFREISQSLGANLGIVSQISP
jgi:hypothetical protein